MAATVSSIIFDGIFFVNDIDKEGKKFDRVSRLVAHSQNEDMNLVLDYNIELFPVKVEDKITLALATSLSRTGPTAGEEGAEAERNIWRPDRKGKTGGLEDDYDYVTYGKIYKFDGGSGEVASVYASCGGLLMSLTGSFRHMADIVLGDFVYILLRK